MNALKERVKALHRHLAWHLKTDPPADQEIGRKKELRKKTGIRKNKEKTASKVVSLHKYRKIGYILYATGLSSIGTTATLTEPTLALAFVSGTFYQIAGTRRFGGVEA